MMHVVSTSSYDVAIEYFCGRNHIRVRSNSEKGLNYLLGSWDPTRLWKREVVA
jgi:hypothetical protein